MVRGGSKSKSEAKAAGTIRSHQRTGYVGVMPAIVSEGYFGGVTHVEASDRRFADEQVGQCRLEALEMLGLGM